MRKRIATCDPNDIEVSPLTNPSVIKAAEVKLGFALPDLLQEIYTQVGCGCLGFPCCFLGPSRSQPAQDDSIDNFSIVELYQQFKLDNIIPTNDDPLGLWPDQLVPFCSWGCHIYSCVDCSKDSFPVFGYDPNLYEYDQLFLHSPSVLIWMEALLNGNDLWMEMKKLSGR